MSDRDTHGTEDLSLTEPKSAPPGQGTARNTRSDAESVGEGTGALLGAASGASVGVVGGPVGVVIGAIAGAVGGWWAGKGIAMALNADDDVSFRRHYEGSPQRLADRSYEEIRPAYVAGHLAAQNPDYDGRTFDEVEEDLRRGWSAEVASQYGEWLTMRSYARTAFDRARGETVRPRG